MQCTELISDTATAHATRPQERRTSSPTETSCSSKARSPKSTVIMYYYGGFFEAPDTQKGLAVARRSNSSQSSNEEVLPRQGVVGSQ